MTDQEIDISQVLPGPCCERYVPEPDELERTLAELGIERADEHPEFTLEPEEGFEFEGAEFDSIPRPPGASERTSCPKTSHCC
jgi:hypothetical protein